MSLLIVVINMWVNVPSSTHLLFANSRNTVRTRESFQVERTYVSDGLNANAKWLKHQGQFISQINTGIKVNMYVLYIMIWMDHTISSSRGDVRDRPFIGLKRREGVTQKTFQKDRYHPIIKPASLSVFNFIVTISLIIQFQFTILVRRTARRFV